MQVSRYKTAELIKATNGKIFACEFIKKDGSFRKMVARLGVAKNLKGGKNGVSNKNSLVTVWDMLAGGYRMINLSTLTALKVAGVKYEVV
ncbi:SH3 beta-barrel fold-containing protein [Sulfurimonas hydrogeniphila]|uniref:SH3 beta-barrel fold-containing protein n=1 Tax=Sulfurimonas TaxID=202746 RepID=UPI00125F04E1|nr:SH3 beta-barrel fold-containing protein [Sulfurimonas hydrogeniphila]